jgi:hypothetical protein
MTWMELRRASTRRMPPNRLQVEYDSTGRYVRNAWTVDLGDGRKGTLVLVGYVERAVLFNHELAAEEVKAVLDRKP